MLAPREELVPPRTLPFATHAPVNSMTDSCENIIFPQLLRFELTI